MNMGKKIEKNQKRYGFFFILEYFASETSIRNSNCL